VGHEPTFQIVNSTDHSALKVLTHRSASLGDSVMKVHAFPAEFRMLQTAFPILLESVGSDDYRAVGLLGFEAGENLYLDDAGWGANYVPAMLKREPFLIHYAGPHDGDEERLLALDVAHPRVGTEAGEPLFDEYGNRSEFLKQVVGLLEQLDEGLKHERHFVDTLLQFDLIESVSFDITLENGDRNQLLGFSTINEGALQRLSGEQLALMSERGFLAPVFMMVASLPNLQNLIDRKNQRLRQSSGLEVFD